MIITIIDHHHYHHHHWSPSLIMITIIDLHYYHWSSPSSSPLIITTIDHHWSSSPSMITINDHHHWSPSSLIITIIDHHHHYWSLSVIIITIITIITIIIQRFLMTNLLISFFQSTDHFLSASWNISVHKENVQLRNPKKILSPCQTNFSNSILYFFIKFLWNHLSL